jgi:hypothetical protein
MAVPSCPGHRKAKFWIAVDGTPNGRMQLHGGIAITNNEACATHDALCHVAGVWANSRHKDKQAFEEPQYGPDGWARYAVRVRSKVRHMIKGQTRAIANGLIVEARQHYEVLRRQVAIAIRSVSQTARESSIRSGYKWQSGRVTKLSQLIVLTDINNPPPVTYFHQSIDFLRC